MNHITTDIYTNFEPIPEDSQGWNGEKPMFEQLIIKLKPNQIIEVGTWKGQSAITMGRAIKKHNLPTKITCVDTWLGAGEFIGSMAHTPERNLLMKHGYPQIYYQFLSNVVHNKLQDVILPLPNTSLIAARWFAEKQIGAEMIYIDASHDYVDVVADCKAYWPLVNKGGVMFGDDLTWKTVRDAVNDFTKESNIQFREEDNFWIIEKN